MPLSLRSSVLALALLASGAAAQASYEAVSNAITTTPGETMGFAWGDMDGDGDRDLLAVNGNGTSTSDLFRNDGGDAFSEITIGPIPIDAGNATAACWSDIDGDADLDLFVVRRSGQFDRLYVNQGGQQGGAEGAFLPDATSVVVTTAADSRGCVTGDLDGDDDEDLFVATSLGQNDLLYLNQGGAQGGTQGVFAKVTSGPVVSDAAPTYRGVLADMDGDGDLDLFAANGSGVPSNLYRNAGNATFTKVTGQHPATLGSESRTARFGDLDGDGDADLVVGNLLADNFLYLNQGGAQGGVQGDFAQVTTGVAANDNSATLDLDLGDYDGDGVLDLFVANCCNSDNLLYRGDGAGAQFTPVSEGPFVGGGGYSNACGFVDYDGDLDLDLYVANSLSAQGNLDFLYRRQKPAAFEKLTEGPLATDVNRPFDLAFGDADADGDVDLFVPNSNGDDDAFFVNQGGGQGGTEGQFAEETGTPPTSGGGDSWAAAFGDLDGDGDLDLVVANRNAENEAFYRNGGGAQGGVPGVFTALTLVPVTTSGGNSRDAGWADWDGDGDLDLHVVNSDGEAAFQFRNNGGLQGGTQGTFTALAGNLTQDAGNCYDAAWSDADVDGDLDVFVANRAGNDFLHINQGGLQGGFEGVFASANAGPVVTSGGDSFAGAWGDMDADGDQDLFVANGSGTNFLFRNLGGTGPDFEALTGGPVVTDPAASRRAAWRDVDGDNLPELFVPNVLGADDYLYANLGLGDFEHLRGPVESDGGNSRVGAFADLDGDLDPDLVVGRHGEPLATFLNAEPGPPPPPWTDLGQGKAGSLGIPLLTGTGSLLPSSPVVLELTQAKAGAHALVALGFSTLNAPVKGGVVVPSLDLLVSGLSTDAAGELLLAATWPPGMPSGFSFYLQEFVTDSAATYGLAFSNALQGTTP